MAGSEQNWDLARSGLRRFPVVTGERTLEGEVDLGQSTGNCGSSSARWGEVALVGPPGWQEGCGTSGVGVLGVGDQSQGGVLSQCWNVRPLGPQGRAGKEGRGQRKQSLLPHQETESAPAPDLQDLSQTAMARAGHGGGRGGSAGEALAWWGLGRAGVPGGEAWQRQKDGALDARSPGRGHWGAMEGV
jgi:hypothetical protein